MLNKYLIELLKNIETYTEEEVDEIKKAFVLANKLHKDQKRQSGEPYIIHTLSVAII